MEPSILNDAGIATACWIENATTPLFVNLLIKTTEGDEILPLNKTAQEIWATATTRPGA